MIELIAELSPRDLDSELKTYFWVYSVCFVIVDKVDFMMDKMSLDPVYHRLIIMKKLSLLELGKVQLNQLGIKYSKFPNLPPYNLNEKIKKVSPLSTPPQNFSTIIPLNETLQQIHNIKDSSIVDLETLFDDFYISLNKRILALHKTLGFDHIGALDEVLILIELSKKEGIDTTQLTKNLEKLEAPLVNSYKLGWNLIEYYLQQTLQIYLNFQQIENFIKLSLKLIPIANTQNSRNFLKFIEFNFTESLKKLNRFLIKPIQDNFELLSITPNISEDKGFNLNLRLSNNLLNNLTISNVQLAMLDLKQGSNQVDNSDLTWFKLDNSELEEGEQGELMNEGNLYNLRLGINELKLTCNDFNAIEYKLEKLLIDLGKLSFILDLSQPDQWLDLSVEYPLITLEPSYSAKGIRIKLNAPYLNLKQFQLKLKCLGNEVDLEDDDENSNETSEIEDKIKVNSINDNKTELIEILPQRVRDWIWLNFKEFNLNQNYSFTVSWKQLGLLKEPLNSKEIKTNYLISINDGGEHWIRYKNELSISKPIENPFEIIDNLQFNNSENNNQSKLISLKLREKFNNLRILDLKLNLLPTIESDKVKEFSNLSFNKDEVIRSESVYSQLFELNNDSNGIIEDKEGDKDAKEDSNADDIIFLDYALKIQYIDLLKGNIPL
ncbi:hypothetical protein CONCODRAFT_144192 [Conidiobolus coronatus NRRL 28638]|uniref:Uncharacterized protein n=1 Tax=Conidiobolus coronatus (strain ATCC 28846 / CBS 209.66 / NRRL 28638) TaxID=796925 RepID=A0A137PHS6_CONC2|nr:hypothetical protein CONCODRAFT_144192 [Conidiobolus coronatus NRRL 28638]|eukprot:KXN74547.1 hypothetical protein CONCODRAFT_144192 [Conidiobolus coronatus NRRL 28638]